MHRKGRLVLRANQDQWRARCHEHWAIYIAFVFIVLSCVNLGCTSECHPEPLIPAVAVGWPQEPAPQRHAIAVGLYWGDESISRLPFVGVQGARVDYAQVRHVGDDLWIILLEAEPVQSVTVSVGALFDQSGGGGEEHQYRVGERSRDLPVAPRFSRDSYDASCGLSGGTIIGRDRWDERYLAWFVTRGTQVLGTRVGPEPLYLDDVEDPGCLVANVVRDNGEIFQPLGCIEAFE